MTPKDPHAQQTSVLIVDAFCESLEVLRTVFERRGVSVLAADGADAGLEVMRRHHPDVVIVDLAAESAADESIQHAYESETQTSASALVFLGKTRLPPSLPDERVIPKPYHYGPLIRTIEQLLVR